jgi:hypothetical protein
VRSAFTWRLWTPPSRSDVHPVFTDAEEWEVYNFTRASFFAAYMSSEPGSPEEAFLKQCVDSDELP